MAIIGNALWAIIKKEEVLSDGASTAARSGVTYTSGIADLAAATISSLAALISNCSAITSNTETVYVDYGDVHRKISIGDQITITMNSVAQLVNIIGFNHDSLTTATAYGSTTATGKAGITLQTDGLPLPTRKMNTSAVSTGGWKSTYMRSTILPSIKSNYLPSEWQSVIKAVNKKAGAGNGSTSLTTVSDTLFLLAHIEIFGTEESVAQGEGTQYKWYATGNTKIKSDEDGTVRNWWTRSNPTTTANVAKFIIVNTSGNRATSVSNGARGTSFAFCV